MILPMLGIGQESQLNKLFDKYSGQKGYTSVHITSYMFELFSKIADEDDADFENVTKGLDAIKILTVSDSHTKTNQEFYDEINLALPASVYKDFMIIKEDGQEILFKVRDEGDKISEFVMIVKDPHEPVLLFLQGDIDLAKVAKMSKSMDIKGFEHLEKVDD
jgi:hypothetical protein